MLALQNNQTLLAQKKLGEFIYQNDLNLTILPTMQCNFRCRYCYENFANSHMKEKEINSIQQYLIENLKNYRNLNIEWFGGEPLLNIPAIEAISDTAIKLCRFYHMPYTSEITTNGYLLNVEAMKRLLKAKISFYQVTIDASEEEHNLNRPLAKGGKTFQTIFTNLLNIKNQIQSSSFKITIRCNVTQNSLNGLTKHFDFLRESFGDDNRFEFTVYPVENWGGNKIVDMQSSLLIDKNTILEKIGEYKNFLNIRQQFRQFQNYGICHSLSLNHFVFVPSGDVYKCTLAFDDPMNHIGKLNPISEDATEVSAYGEAMVGGIGCSLDW